MYTAWNTETNDYVRDELFEYFARVAVETMGSYGASPLVSAEEKAQMAAGMKDILQETQSQGVDYAKTNPFYSGFRFLLGVYYAHVATGWGINEGSTLQGLADTYSDLYVQAFLENRSPAEAVGLMDVMIKDVSASVNQQNQEAVYNSLVATKAKLQAKLATNTDAASFEAAKIKRIQAIIDDRIALLVGKTVANQ
jgi:hypothetical protein